MQSLTEKGTLYIVATPIGNLEDMTYRAVEVLKNSELILCENPNNSKKLLFRYQIETKTAPLYASTRETGFDWIFELMAKGNTISYISDAGTPGISDPGYLLAKAGSDHHIEMICLPGATAFVPALVVSGLPNNEFLFAGFLPQKKGRQTKLKQLAEELGPYPHARLTVPSKVIDRRPRPRAKCSECGFTVPMLKAFIHYGPPICPKDKIEMTAIGDWEEMY